MTTRSTWRGRNHARNGADGPESASCWVAAALGALLVTSCIEVRDANVDGPPGESDLTVLATTSTPTVFEGAGQAVVLSAAPSGGRPPYSFRWNQNDGPDVELSNISSPTLTIDNLTAVGRYVFRVRVTDAEGFAETEFVVVEVLSAVTADVPSFAMVGEPADLRADLAVGLEDATILWEITQGTATIAGPFSASTTLTTTAGETVRLRLSVTPPGGDADSAAQREFEVVSVFDLHPRVRVATNFGEFVIEVDGEAAPRHMVNFLLYVDDGFYDGLLFHRNACTENAETGQCDPFVLQGGGYRRDGDDLVFVEPTRDPVERENDNTPSNGTLYSVALALSGGNPDSGTTQFFINLGEDNSFLDAQGFTVFGQVVEGTDVVDAIVATPRVESPIIAGEISLPEDDVVMERVSRVE